MLLTGLRGVGKTVLLNEIERMAQTAGYRTLLVEAHEGKSLAVLLAPHLRLKREIEPGPIGCALMHGIAPSAANRQGSPGRLMA